MDSRAGLDVLERKSILASTGIRTQDRKITIPTKISSSQLETVLLSMNDTRGLMLVYEYIPTSKRNIDRPRKREKDKCS